ncbi:MAG: hypothetical protein ACI9TI_002074 [Natronomonas sp.]|jgi:hypothetical protein
MRFVTADLGEPLSLKNVTGQHSMYPEVGTQTDSRQHR